MTLTTWLAVLVGELVLGRRDDVPISLAFVVLRPAVEEQSQHLLHEGQPDYNLRASHVHVVHIGTVLAGFQDKDVEVWVF